MNKPYYPSNGTEGMVFVEMWCVKCKRDPASRNIKSRTSCSILMNSIFIGQPKQWVYIDDKPTCTSFTDLKSKPKTHRKNKSQLELI